MNYGCNDAAEALAAYALDALAAGERLLLVEHLAECREHDEELAGYRSVTSRLALTVEASAAPPSGLRTGLLEAFDRELTAPADTVQAEPALATEQTAAVTAAEPLPSIAPVVESSRPGGGFLSIFRQPALAYGMAAALLLAVIGLGAWNLSLQDGGEVMTTAAAGPGMSLRVSYYMDQQVAVLDVDMPPPAAGKVYQAWMIDSAGRPVSLGVLESNKGRMAFAGDMSHASAVAISLEPAGGSPTPTQPVVQAKF